MIQVAAAIIEQQGSYLLSRRMVGSHLEGYWEFPGGKRKGKESLETCVQRELLEELGVIVKVGALFQMVRHRYPDKSVELHFFRCVISEGTPEAIGCQEWRWVRPKDFGHYIFPPADEQVIERLLENSS